jgi:SNF2 family DNA or RNA helicase
MVEIVYDHAHQAIQVSAKDRFDVWAAVSRVFEENSQEMEVVSSYSVRLPVWEFLSCRKSLVYVLEKYDLGYEVDNRVRQILKTAIDREKLYQNQLLSGPLDQEIVVNTLQKKGFIRSLTKEQKRNIAKLVSLPAGATFSVPGAGKTTEALAYYYYKRTPKTKLMVVCPKNAFAAWEEQLQLCVDNPPEIKRLVGGEKTIQQILETSPEILLITYQQLPNVKNILAEYLLKFEAFLFLDESHRIKRGATGQWASNILSLSHLPIAKLIMSGTPLPNSANDLLPQINFLYPELDLDVSDIANAISPIFVRTTKDELGLPKVHRIYTPIQLRPKQRNLYELLRSEEYRQLANLSSRERILLRSVGKSVVKLLQLVSNPALLAKDDGNFSEDVFDALSEGDSPKIEYACQKARFLARENKKVLIWSTFVENVETISERLVDLGADFIHGGVDAGSEEDEETREWKIKNFHENPNSFVLVANPAACAEGISLHTVCHHAIYIDRNYNAALYLQSEDRIHRLGLPKNVETTVEILYSPDTVDESVRRRLKNKVDLMSKVLNDQSLTIEPFEPDFDADGITQEDVNDFINHLKREP